MTSKLPATPEEVQALADISPEFAAAWEKMPLPRGIDYGSIEKLKQLVESSLPQLQKGLVESRLSTVTEREVSLQTRDGWESRTIVCYPTNPDSPKPSPLLMMLYGGGHCVGSPESELALARLLVQAHNMVVVLPSYRLAPKYPYPYSINDSWDCLQALAAEARSPHASSVLPSFTDASAGFIIAGTSAGSTISASVAHLARDNKLSPPLTGQGLFAGSVTAPSVVPDAYKNLYLSRTQPECTSAPILDKEFYDLFREAYKPDVTDKLYSSFNQYHPDDKDGRVGKGHVGVAPAYIQVCGMDMSRDDGLMYERVLREESGVPTRIDIYAGFPHCWWAVYSDLTSSKQRTDDTVDGIAWLLSDAHREMR